MISIYSIQNIHLSLIHGILKMNLMFKLTVSAHFYIVPRTTESKNADNA